MPKKISQKSEEVFSKLPDYGYSEKGVSLIWQWYHPSKKVDAILISEFIRIR